MRGHGSQSVILRHLSPASQLCFDCAWGGQSQSPAPAAGKVMAKRIDPFDLRKVWPSRCSNRLPPLVKFTAVV